MQDYSYRRGWAREGRGRKCTWPNTCTLSVAEAIAIAGDVKGECSSLKLGELAQIEGAFSTAVPLLRTHKCVDHSGNRRMAPSTAEVSIAPLVPRKISAASKVRARTPTTCTR